MAEMGLGYGSEFQLMRFLGHHRNYLNTLIRETVKIDGEIQWLDYPADNTRLSGDGEWENILCFEKLKNYTDITNKWKDYWPPKGKGMNWDGIFRIGDIWFFVEAKAHEGECRQKCQASETSKDIIARAFRKTQEWLKADKPKSPWIDSNCYQLANRLTFLYFCKTQDIQAKLLYIGFLNGFKEKVDEVTDIKRWISIWNEEFKTLGLDEEIMSSHIYFIYPDCDNPPISY